MFGHLETESHANGQNGKQNIKTWSPLNSSKLIKLNKCDGTFYICFSVGC